MLLVSPYCTLENYLSLFQNTNCEVVVTPAEPQSPIVAEIQGKLSIRIIHCPDLHTLLGGTFSHYPFPKTFAEARSEPLIVIHTSGTTASPKPVVYSHDFAASFIQWGQLEPPEGFESQIALMQSNRLLLTLPFFHVSDSTILRKAYVKSFRTAIYFSERFSDKFFILKGRNPIHRSF